MSEPERFIKFIPSEEAFYLMHKHPNAFRLLSHIANTARRYDGHPDGLSIGQCHLRHWEKYDLTEKEYRTAKQVLKTRKHIVIISTNRKCKKGATKRATNSTLVQICSLTVYDINTEDKGDQKGDRRATEGRQTRKNKKEKEDHPLTPSFSKSSGSDDFDDEDDLLTARSNKKDPDKHIYGHVYMNDAQIQECSDVLMARGIQGVVPGIEGVKYAVEAILTSPGRSYTIKNWQNALATWKIPDNFKLQAQQHEEIANELCRKYNTAVNSITCKIHHDRKKDVRGLVFEGGTGNYTIWEFFAFSDALFKEKVMKFQQKNKMSKAFKK